LVINLKSTTPVENKSILAKSSKEYSALISLLGSLMTGNPVM